MAQGLVAELQDRFFTPIDPLLRNARRRFILIVIVALLLHGSLLAVLLLRDHSKPQTPIETPVEVIVLPPPQPKPEPKKEPPPPPKPQPKEKPQPKKDKPATDTPPAANKEQIRRDNAEDKTESPVKGAPQPNAVMKPVPNQAKASLDAAPSPAEKTAAPDTPEDKPDAEPVAKPEPLKDKPSEKQKPTKEKTPVATHSRSSLAQEFASLSEAPHYSIATPAKPSPVSGGHCNTNPYLCTLYGLIMRQQHYPETARRLHVEGKVVVAFWIDERGDLVHQAVYRTSGYPDLDNEAVAAIRRAAPYPPPPPGAPHGFVAQMEFPPK
jgi:TonB family protein